MLLAENLFRRIPKKTRRILPTALSATENVRAAVTELLFSIRALCSLL
jgi:hypothetical protein